MTVDNLPLNRWYEFFTPSEGNVVVDLGACVGKATVFFAKHVGSEGRVIAVEPVLENYKILMAIIMEHGFTNVIPWMIAIAGKTGQATINLSESRESHSLYFKHNFVGKRITNTITWNDLVEVLNLKRVDLLKMNIEGGEVEVLRSMTKVLPRRIEMSEHVRQFSSDPDTCNSLRAEITDELKKKGFKTVTADDFLIWAERQPTLETENKPFPSVEGSKKVNPFSSVKFLFFQPVLQGLLQDWQTVHPIKADIDATNMCNQDCIRCYVKEFRKRVPVSMSLDDMYNALKQVAELGCRAVLLSGAGESLCNDEVFPEAFHRAKELGMLCALNTNGTLIDKYVEDIAATCTYVKVSINAGTAETYRKVHRSDLWDKVWNNIAQLRKIYQGMLGVDFLIHPENYTEVLDFLLLAKKHDVSYCGVRPVLLHGFRLHNHILENVKRQVKTFTSSYPTPPVYARMQRGTTQKTYSKCFATPLTVTVGADMNVYPCCVTRGRSDLVLGNIRESSLQEIWFGRKRKKIVESIDVAKCLPCKYDRANVIINQMKETIHKEFI